MSEPIRISVGSGTSEGTNSAYVLPDQGVVVDPGPPSDRAWTDLRRSLEERSLRFEDIEHVFVTHWHVDHAGLADRLAIHADASIHLHRADAPLVGSYAEARERRLRRDARTMERWGVPEPIRDVVIEGDTTSPLPDARAVNRRDDGDVVAGVEFVHTPGHTKGHVALKTGETILLGDLLLPTYTPNVGGSDTRLRDPLGAYLDAIERVESHEYGDPGHGTRVRVAAEINEVRHHHRNRAENAFRAVAAADETAATPWTVARRLFGEMEGIHAKFGAGEAAAHLERLAELDLLERITGEQVRFRPVVDSYPTGLALTA